MEMRRFFLHLLKGRWIVVVVSFYVMSCAGATYIFSIYSGSIKKALHYNQETIDTLSFFKDLGANVGILSGLLNEVVPSWVVLAVGAGLNMFGYLMIWLAVTQRIARPPVWQMYLYMCVGANSQTFANTGVLVRCVKNFPQSRGVVLGLLKGFVGLSGAIFTQIYQALYGQDTTDVILLVGWLPSLVSLLFMFFVRPMKPVTDENEGKHFFSFLYLALLLAGFLMIIIIVENQVPFSSATFKTMGLLTVLLVVSNVWVAVRAELESYDGRSSVPASDIPLQTMGEKQKESCFTNPGSGVVSSLGKNSQNGHGMDLSVARLCDKEASLERDTQKRAIIPSEVQQEGEHEHAERLKQNQKPSSLSANSAMEGKHGKVIMNSEEDPSQSLNGKERQRGSEEKPSLLICEREGGHDKVSKEHHEGSSNTYKKNAEGKSPSRIKSNEGGHDKASKEHHEESSNTYKKNAEDKSPSPIKSNECKHAASRRNPVKAFFSNWPERGEDFTIPQALLSLDMWILFVASTCGVGGTLTAIDNMGQIGEALGYSKVSITTCVALISIWNFLGRVIAGFASEMLLQRYSFPRPLVLTIVLGVACVADILIAFPSPGSLYIASILTGLCFGAQWPIMYAVISELFGLKYYATLYNFGAVASPLGSYLLNVRVAGYLYDREARKQQLLQEMLGKSSVATMSVLAYAAAAPSPSVVIESSDDLTCVGPQCFRLTFLIMTAVSAVGSLVSAVLVLRTRKFYSQDIYAKFRQSSSTDHPHSHGVAQPSSHGSDEDNGKRFLCSTT